MIPVTSKGQTTRYKIAKDILPGTEVTETHKGFNAPIPEFDEGIYEKYMLKRDTYNECIELMKKEIRACV